MTLKSMPTDIPDVIVFTPDVFNDPRGFFMETFNEERYAGLGLSSTFVQDNYSHSRGGTLRGLHYQLRRPQAKLMSVIWGEIFDVAVDIRRGSPTFGKWVGQTLSDKNRCQLYIPAGFAHGFCVLSESADVMYKCSDYYSSSDDHGVLWSDPGIGIHWPTETPVLSDKDARHLPLSELPPENLPPYHA